MRACRDGTLPVVQLRRPTIALLAIALAAGAAPTPASAQTRDQLEKLFEEQAEDLLSGDGAETIDPAESGGVVGGGDLPDAIDPPVVDDEDEGALDELGGALPPAEATPPPVPPAYLVPGPSAGRMPVSAVANLTEPVVEAEPLRIAALSAAALAALALATAAALRALGLRDPLASPVAAAAPPGRLRRVADRSTALADDMRDFLRRAR